jgi:hypothetical protein
MRLIRTSIHVPALLFCCPVAVDQKKVKLKPTKTRLLLLGTTLLVWCGFLGESLPWERTTMSHINLKGQLTVSASMDSGWTPPKSQIGSSKICRRYRYITTAEKKPDWEELKKQASAWNPKPQESTLVPGSLVFSPHHTRITG